MQVLPMKQRFAFQINNLKGVAIVCVILIHATMRFMDARPGPQKLLLALIDFSSHFAVPLLFMILGFRLYATFTAGRKRRLSRKKIFGSVLGLIRIYLVYAIIYAAMKLVLSTEANPLHVLIDIATFNIQIHYWFVPTVVMFYLTANLLFRLIDRSNLFVFFPIILVISVFAPSSIDRLASLAGRYEPVLGVLIRNLLNFVSHLHNFVFGVVILKLAGGIGRRELPRSSIPLLLVFLGGFLFSINLYGGFLWYRHSIQGTHSTLVIQPLHWLLFFVQSTTTAGLLFLILHHYPGLQRSFFVRKLGVFGLYSYGIYNIHYLFVSQYFKILKRTFLSEPLLLQVALVSVLSILTVYFFCKLMGRWSFTARFL